MEKLIEFDIVLFGELNDAKFVKLFHTDIIAR